LLLINAAGKVLRTLTTGEENIMVRSVRFSPDGKQALYVAYGTKGYRLCVSTIATAKS